MSYYARLQVFMVSAALIASAFGAGFYAHLRIAEQPRAEIIKQQVYQYLPDYQGNALIHADLRINESACRKICDDIKERSCARKEKKNAQ